MPKMKFYRISPIGESLVSLSSWNDQKKKSVKIFENKQMSEISQNLPW